MASSALVLHGGGAREVSMEALKRIPCPEPTETYFPVPHHRVIETCVRTLEEANFQVDKLRVCVARNDQQLFATVDLKTAVCNAVNLCIGLRSSVNRTLPLGLIAGNRVFCCSNLSFRADLINVRRKHTRNGELRFNEAISNAILTLNQFKEAEGHRITHFQHKEITHTEAESLILRSWEQGIISPRHVLRVAREFREPSFEDFTENGFTFWRLENAFTTVLGEIANRSPQRYSHSTMRLHALLASAAEVATPTPA